MRRNKKEAFNDASFLYCIENHSLFNYIIQFVRLPGKLPVKVYFLCVIKRSKAFAPFLSGASSFSTIVPKALKTRENPGECCGLLLKRSRCVR